MLAFFVAWLRFFLWADMPRTFELHATRDSDTLFVSVKPTTWSYASVSLVALPLVITSPVRASGASDAAQIVTARGGPDATLMTLLALLASALTPLVPGTEARQLASSTTGMAMPLAALNTLSSVSGPRSAYAGTLAWLVYDPTTRCTVFATIFSA